MNSKKYLKAAAVSALIVILAAALTGCMSINMREEKIVERMKGGGYTVAYVSLPDWTADAGNYNASVSKTIRAENKSTSSLAYIYFCNNSKSADWIKTRCDGNSGTSPAPVKDYITYVYKNADIVIYGDYAAVSLARTY